MSAATANLPALPSSLTPEGNLSRYLSEIRKFPLLEPQEEFMLAKRWREHGDSKAAHRLVTSHLRLVAKIAMGYRGYGLPVAELISEGNVGMMQAVKRFDPDRGFRLATYAMWWIRASIQEYILHSWSLVKMGTTAAQKKLFFNLRKLKGQMQAIEEGDLTPEQVTKIATRLGVPEEEVVNMNRRLAAPDSSLNAPVKAEGDMEWQDWLVDDSPNQEARLAESQELGQRKHMLAQALKQLTDRERHIIVERRLVDEPKTLEDLSAKYGISRERVRQIEVRAFDKLQKAMKNMVVEAAARDVAAARPQQPGSRLAEAFCASVGTPIVSGERQGRANAMQTSFALHHLAHAHNMLAHGKLVDPTGLMPAIKKHQKAAE
jgi:RNA polymerase sigma-32 factor